MSVELYTVRIFYYPPRPGCVRIAGLHRHITQPPTIPGLPTLEAIDFAPETATYMLQPEFEGSREMKDTEIAAVHAWLELVGRGEA